MRSIRNFLIIVLLASITLINFLAALHGYRTSLLAANQLFDEELSQLADVLGASAANGPGPAVRPTDSYLAYQVWDKDQLLVSSANVEEIEMAPREAGFHELNFNRHRWRALVRRSRIDDGQWLMVAERMDRRFELAEKVIIEAVLPIVLSLPLIGFIVWFVVSRGMQPLAQLASQLRRKRPEDLTPVRNLAETVELNQLVNSVNDLLGRMAAALQREQRFAANAAHELRTPLSVLKVQLYNLQQEMDGPGEALHELESGLDRLSHLVEQILALHLSGGEGGSAGREQVALLPLCREVIGDLYSTFELKNQEIELRGDERAYLSGYPQAIKTLLSNLLVNAGKYGPQNGRVRVSVARRSAGVCLLVEDSGPGIPPEERDQVFERFYRIGGDRHDSGELGCGLGLSIVKQIVDAHGGEIRLDRSEDLGGLKVEIVFKGEAT